MHYGDSAIFQFNDRLLTHLRTIILAKFALQESLALTWHDSDQQRTVWLHPSIPLHFEFSGSETPELNHAWLEQLMALANSPGGLRCVAEPESA